MKASVLVGLCVVILGAGYGVTACVGDDPSTAPVDADAGGGGTKALGDLCGTASDCASASCADGVCCDSACTGTCEKCNLGGSVGKCLPVPDGDDPDKECPTAPLPAPVDSDAGVDASADPFVTPDAGITSDDNMCAGKCNGKRACAYAGTERTCGSVYCGNTTEQGRAACDAKGHCVFGIEECSAYACADGSPGCKSTCAAETDCLATHFCDGATNTCKPKLSNGTKCTSVVECKSGNCEDTVCCNSVCGSANSSCNSAGNVGTCVCPECPSGAACALYYQDEDGDTYGDAKGTVGNGRAKYACAAGPAPAGFVANKADCYDGPPATAAPSVHPGQTAFFAGAYTPPGGAPTFDYDCSGLLTKETPEFVGGSCRFCNASSSAFGACTLDATCKTGAGQQAGLTCQSRQARNQCTINAGGIGAGIATNVGYTGVVACGAAAVKYSCGTCTAVNGVVTGGTAVSTVQRCR
jgi:hypothetical protein